MYDILIKGGRVIDGTGSPWRKADVGINGESIAKIGLIPESDAERVVDARGLVVSPGWIDIHVHADHTVLGNPACLSYAHQGITTVMLSQSGSDIHQWMALEPMKWLKRLEVKDCPLDDAGWKTLDAWICVR